MLVAGLVAWFIVGRATHAFREILVQRRQDDEDDRRVGTVMRVVRGVICVALAAVVLMHCQADPQGLLFGIVDKHVRRVATPRK